MFRMYHEIFADFTKLKNREARIGFLRSNDSITMRKIMRAAFHPNIKFFLTGVPSTYKPNPAIKDGMCDYTLDQAINKIYLFELGNPRSAQLTYKKRESLLLQFAEGMPPSEAIIFFSILLKTLNVKYLTPNLVRETWPGLIPDDPQPTVLSNLQTPTPTDGQTPQE